MNFARYVTFAALLLSVVGSSLPARAQNNKQVISGTFYEDQASGVATAQALLLKFVQTPANKFLNITNVNCNITTALSEVVADVRVQTGSVSGGNDLGRDHSIRGTLSPETGSVYKYYGISNSAVYFKLGPGRYPSIYISTPTASAGSLFTAATCYIVGDLSDY